MAFSQREARQRRSEGRVESESRPALTRPHLYKEGVKKFQPLPSSCDHFIPFLVHTYLTNGGSKKTKRMESTSSVFGLSSSFTLRPKHRYLGVSNVEARATIWFGRKSDGRSSANKRVGGQVRCEGRSIEDFIGGDLLKFDMGQWLSDVEEHKAIAIYTPHEGGYEGRYLNRLRYQGYYFLDLSARGLGDPETTLTKIHPVCPSHLGKQPIARWYYPPEVDYRLAALPPDAKGLVVWIIEAKVLSKAELQFLALLPTLRPKVRVIAECGNWRKFVWKPLKEIAGLTVAANEEA